MRRDWLAPDWPAPRGVGRCPRCAAAAVSAAPYASLNWVTMSGDAPAAVAENRRRLRAAAGCRPSPCWLAQVHGIGGARPGCGPRTHRRRRDARRDAPQAGTGLRHPHGGLPARPAGRRTRGMWWRRPMRAGAAWPAGSSRRRCVPLGACRRAGCWHGSGPAIGPQHFEVGAEVREALLARRSRARVGVSAERPRPVHGGSSRCSRAGVLTALGVEPHLWRRRVHLCRRRTAISRTGAMA